MVFDVRFLPNPHWDEHLRPMSGKDAEVQEYVTERPLARDFIDHVDQLMTSLIPAFSEEGKSYLTVAFGCTGGRHRSVAITEIVAERLTRLGWPLRVIHRDIDK